MFPYTTCLQFNSKRKAGSSRSVRNESTDQINKPSKQSKTKSLSSSILRFKCLSKNKECKGQYNFLIGNTFKAKKRLNLSVSKEVIITPAVKKNESFKSNDIITEQAPRLSICSIKYVDDTDTATDFLSEKILESDSSNFCSPIKNVEPLPYSSSISKTKKIERFKSEDDGGLRLSINKNSDSSSLPRSDENLDQTTNYSFLQSNASSISVNLNGQHLKPSYTFDLRHYQVGGLSATITNVPWNNEAASSNLIDTANKEKIPANKHNKISYFSRPSSKQDYYVNSRLNYFNTARQSLDASCLDQDENFLKQDLRCAEQTRCLLTLKRKAEIRKKKARIDSLALLDLAYHGLACRFLLNSRNWNFNSFTLDTLSGGHSLSQLLVYFFCKYNFISIYNLDMTAVWKCFRLFENGYHDTNPYHNSVHAADVSQAMQCFIEQEKIKPYLTPLESMCSLLAAVAHDLDHPGVNQHFLVATNSHLAVLYQNLSVLESHHWRFAMSCIHESKIFDHFDSAQMLKIQNYLSSLILATDVTQQQQYLQRFRLLLGYGKPKTYLNSFSIPSTLNSSVNSISVSTQDNKSPKTLNAKNLSAPANNSCLNSRDQSPVRFIRTPSDCRRPFATIGSNLIEVTDNSSLNSDSSLVKTTTAFTGTMMDALKLHIADNDLSTLPMEKCQLDLTNKEHRLFILQIALKCADLGNPCRVWPLSKQWTQQICTEFYRQGDFERQLNMQVSPVCDRFNASMAKIQIEFFRNIVSPLFCLWHRFLNSSLSRKMICNLTFNNSQWLNSLGKSVGKKRHSISSCQANEYANIINKQIKTTSTLGSSIPAKQITASLSMSDLNIENQPIINKLFKDKNKPDWNKKFSQWLNDQKKFSNSIEFSKPNVLIKLLDFDDQNSISNKSVNELKENLDIENKSFDPKIMNHEIQIVNKNAEIQLKSVSKNDYPQLSSSNKFHEHSLIQHSNSFNVKKDNTNQFLEKDFQKFSAQSTSTGKIADKKNLELLTNTFHVLSPQLSVHLNERRGSAPGCIEIYSSCELAAALMFFQHSKNTNTTTSNLTGNSNNLATPVAYPWKLSTKNQKRRSSFPVNDYSHNCVQLNSAKINLKTKNQLNNSNSINDTINKLSANKSCGQQIKELTAENMKKIVQTGRHAYSLDSSAECKQLLINKPRRSSIPQEVLIESLSNYCAHAN